MKTPPLVFFPNSESVPERLRRERPCAVSIPSTLVVLCRLSKSSCFESRGQSVSDAQVVGGTPEFTPSTPLRASMKPKIAGSARSGTRCPRRSRQPRLSATVFPIRMSYPPIRMSYPPASSLRWRPRTTKATWGASSREITRKRAATLDALGVNAKRPQALILGPIHRRSCLHHFGIPPAQAAGHVRLLA